MLSPEDAEELYTQLYKPLMMAQFIQYGLIAFGYLCLLSIIVVLLVKALQVRIMNFVKICLFACHFKLNLLIFI